MAQKKISKKHLEKRVAKLKKKVATLTTGLSKKQSDLSRSLSSVRKKQDKLRKQQDSGRNKKLLQTTEKLASRLRRLEKSVSSVGRAGEALAKRTDALEAQAAEASDQGDALPRHSGEPDGSLLHGIELLRDRTQVVEDHLARLAAAQEGLELQIALLSREAEAGLTSQPDLGLPRAERTDELPTSLKDVPSSVDRGGQDTADLAERSRQLENSANELLQAEQALENRVDQLEQQSAELQQRGRSDDDPEQGHQPLELETRVGRDEEAIHNLSRRTAVLEAGHGSLAEEDARLAGQLQAVETRLSELAQRAGGGEGAPVPGNALHDLEEKVALLSADRSLNQSRIEEVSHLTETLEKVGVNYTRHTDVLSDRITALNDRLEKLVALDAERRLDELERRGEALEQALQAETADLGELRQTEETLERRLEMAIADAEALEIRIGKLNDGGEQLNEELARLDSAFEAAAKEAQQQYHRLQAHETLLGQQKQQLDAILEGQSKANEGLSGRVAAIDESRQALQEASDGLRVQQVRQDQDTQILKQKLKRRTILGLLMFLLTAGGLLYLLLRGPVISEDVQLALQAGSAPNEKAAAVIANIEDDLVTMRRELAELQDSLTQVARSVEDVNSVAAPELPAQVMRLNETVGVLERQDLQQQQQTAELRREQAQQEQAGAELRTSQEQLQAELERISGEVKSLGEKASAPPAKATAPRASVSRPGADKAWAQARESGRYTLQLAGFHRPESLATFKNTHDLGDDTAVYVTEYQGRKWHVVFHGIFETVGQAVAAARQLSPELAARQPWVRRIPPAGEILPF